MDYGDCNSPRDTITLDEWSENPPTVKIIFYHENGKIAYTNCFHSDSLRYWLDLSENTFALFCDWDN